LYRRLRELLGGERLPIVAAGVLFGVFHLPDPFLTAVTVALGELACWLYEREPNLLALGIWHGLTSFMLFHWLPTWLKTDLIVGPQILPYLAWPFWGVSTTKTHKFETWPPNHPPRLQAGHGAPPNWATGDLATTTIPT